MSRGSALSVDRASGWWKAFVPFGLAVLTPLCVYSASRLAPGAPGWAWVLYATSIAAAGGGVVFGWRYRNMRLGSVAMYGLLAAGFWVVINVVVFLAALTNTLDQVVAAGNWWDDLMAGLGAGITGFDAAVAAVAAVAVGSSLAGLAALTGVNRDTLPARVSRLMDDAVDLLVAQLGVANVWAVAHLVARLVPSPRWSGSISIITVLLAVPTLVVPVVTGTMLRATWLARRHPFRR